MKNLIIIIFLLLYPVSVYADENDKNMYLKMDAITTSKVGGVKQYSLISPDVAAGVGYYLSDSYRADLVAGKCAFSFEPKYISWDEITNDGSAISGTKRINYRTQANYLLLSNYLDVITRDDFTIFVNAGIGAAKIREKSAQLFSGMSINGEIITIPLSIEQYKSKPVNKFIYSLGGGTGIRVHPMVNVDLTYNYKHFGKPKYKAQDNKYIASVKVYKSHNISIGVRLDL